MEKTKTVTRKKPYSILVIVTLLTAIITTPIVYVYASSLYTDSTIPPETQESYSYLIFKADSTIYARNGKTGAIDYSGTDASTVIQSALDALTRGRTWKEKVIAKGDYVFSGKISIPSKTFLVIDKVSLSNGYSETSVFLISAKNDVELHIGELDGNKANQTSGISGIVIDGGSQDVIIHGHVHDFHANGGPGDGVRISDSINVDIDVISNYNDRHGIAVYGNVTKAIIKGKCDNNGVNGIWVNGASTLEEAREVYVYGVCKNNGNTGIYIDAWTRNIVVVGVTSGNSIGLRVTGQYDGTPYYLTENIDIIGTSVGDGRGVDIAYVRKVSVLVSESRATSDYGAYIVNSHYVQIRGVYTNNTKTGVYVDSNCDSIDVDVESIYNTEHGLVFGGSYGNIKGIYKSNSQGGAGSYDGINVGGQAVGISIIGVVSTDPQGTQTQRYGLRISGSNCTVIGNYFKGNRDGAIDSSGSSGCVIDHNIVS